MRPGLRRGLLAGVAVVWMFAVIFGYYVAHKPFTPANVLAIINSLGDVATAAALYALAAALGRRALRRFTFDSPLEETIFQCDIGLEDAQLDRLAHLRYLYHSVDAIVDDLRRERHTHVLLHRTGMDQVLQLGTDRVTREDAAALQDLLSRYDNQVYSNIPLQIVTRNGMPAVLGASDDAYAIYELTPFQGANR